MSTPMEVLDAKLVTMDMNSKTASAEVSYVYSIQSSKMTLDINECNVGVSTPGESVTIQRLCKVSNQKKTFWEAVDFCRAQGGQLFEPRTWKDEQFLDTIDEDLFVGVDKSRTVFYWLTYQRLLFRTCKET